jgi:hypothetical protein
MSNRDDIHKLTERCLVALSDCGYFPYATFNVLHRALKRKEDGIDTFSKSHVVSARRVASQIINNEIKIEGEIAGYWSYMFNCLEGKVEQICGNTSRAITLLERAVKLEPRAKLVGPRMQEYTYDLFAPWQYLTELYKTRFLAGGKRPEDLVDYRKYLEIGCQKDDPVSHWQAAEHAKKYQDGFHSPTSKWLYHCLKAAASGHLQAAYSLANFYRNSGWRYLEDDPPDHVKPTPFDHRFPDKALDRTRGFFGDIGEFLRRVFTDVGSIGDFAGIKAEDPHHALFHTAIYPSTPEERMRLAIEWFNVASDFNFAPAYLVKAKIHLEQTLWAGAEAPAPALTLSPDRYGIIEASPDTDEDKANPYYSTSRAKEAIREVLRACQMGEIKREQDLQFKWMSEQYSSHDRSSHDAIILSHAYDRAPEAAKFFFDVHVWDQFADDLPRLEREAKALCREHGLDIYETDGLLVFRGTA